MLTSDKVVILVSLIDQNQKNISLPQGIKYISHSLNMMIQDTPYLIVANKIEFYDQMS